MVQSMVLMGNRLFTSGAGDENRLLLWDLDSNDRPKSFEGHEKAVISVAVSGNRLFSGSEDWSLKIWEIDSFRCVSTIQCDFPPSVIIPTGNPEQVVIGFSPDTV